MSGSHARPRPESSIRLAVWRPIAALALLGAGGPAVVLVGASDARSAPAPVSSPDVDPGAATTAHHAPRHPCRCGPRSSP